LEGSFERRGLGIEGPRLKGFRNCLKAFRLSFASA